MTYQRERELICRLGRQMWQRGWVASNDGNLSLRVAPDRYLVTPTGVSKGFMKPDMLLVVDGTGQVVEPRARGASSELPLHLMCYAARPDVGGVCHAHPPAATAFACARLPLDAPILGETLMTLGTVPVAPYARTGTQALPEAVRPLLARHNGVLLANHGALTVGETLEKAYDRMESLEHTAQIHLNVRLLGGGVPLDEEQAAALRG